MSVLEQKRTARIVATVGPACWDPENLRRLLDAGVDVFRVNAAHNQIAERREIVGRIRTAVRASGRNVGILQDLAGPKPRTGPLPEGETLPLNLGEQVTLIGGNAPLTPGHITIDDPDLVEQLHEGQRVLMADGLLEVVVERHNSATAQATVVRGGRLRGRQGVTVPGAPAPPRELTQQEIEDIAFAAEADLEYLGISFVTAARDVTLVRDELHRRGGRAAIVAKIERPEALAAIHDIAHVADAVMVARGDLGVQLPPEEVPLAQKEIIRTARVYGTPVITATQMLESMITAPIPTRAETSDVANAVLDGTDAVMLSGETATGEFPVEAVEMMDRIVRAVEQRYPATSHRETELPATIASTVARAASDLARRSPLINLIAVFTRSGFSAREVARERPSVPIVALTQSGFVARQMALVWGITAVVEDDFSDDSETLIRGMGARLIEHGYARPGDHVLVVGSLKVFQEPGHTDLLHLRRL